MFLKFLYSSLDRLSASKRELVSLQFLTNINVVNSPRGLLMIGLASFVGSSRREARGRSPLFSPWFKSEKLYKTSATGHTCIAQVRDSTFLTLRLVL